MVKKAAQDPFSDHIKDSAQQIWLAGLGAFTKAQAEGGKVFDALVKEGLSMQNKSQTAAEEKLAEVAQKMTSVATDLGTRATGQWDKLETVFEDRVAKALHRLGIPTAQEMDELKARVAALSLEVSRFSAPAKRGVARKRAPTGEPTSSPKRARK